MKYLILVLSLLLVACAASPPKVVVRTQLVKVPIAARVSPPKQLYDCGKGRPRVTFKSPAMGSTDVLLEESDQRALQMWVDSLERCLKGWRAWSK